MPYSIRDDEIVIDPLVFDIRFDSSAEYVLKRWKQKIESDAYLFDKQFSLVLDKLGGDIYNISNFSRIFGFQNLSREQSVQRARDVHKTLEALYSSDFNLHLGFSTLGLKEHEHIHKNLSAYKYTPEFSEIMTSYVRFLGIEEYGKWVKGYM